MRGMPGKIARADVLRAQLPFTLREASPSLDSLGHVYRGKVRDTYRRGDRLVMVTSDRLSAFDKVLTTVPFKGELLNRLALFWFEKTKDVAPNHVLDAPDPQVLVARACRPLPVEVVVRGYLTGSLWRDYLAGHGATAYGLALPEGMRKDEAFAEPIVTPSTKAPKGQHDLPLSPAEIVGRGLVEKAVWDRAVAYALALFDAGRRWAATRGLVLVDTKYELGLAEDDGALLVIDEIHTPDSSRYWLADGSAERFARGEAQRMLDKENMRQWLIAERGYLGDGPLPDIPDDVRVSLAEKYAELYERLTGDAPPLVVGPVGERVERALRAAGYLG